MTSVVFRSDPCRQALRPLSGATLAVCSGLAALAVLWAAAARAQTFNDASSAALRTLCTNGIDEGSLSNVCAAGGDSGSAAGASAISSPTAAAFIEERRRLAEGDASTKPGASADAETLALGQGWSAFVSAGGESLDHRNNKYEDGYSSAVPVVTFGADYRVNAWMNAGLAFNFTYQDGTYDDGGHFHTGSYGPLLYASFTPLPNTFADAALGYNHQDLFRNRPARAFDATGDQIASGHARGNFNGDQYSAGILTGYDHPFEGFTIGPRAGVNFVYDQIENYSESSDTGLQLRYQGLSQSSLQTTLGAVGTMPVSTSFGVVQPQLGVSWVHEFLNDARNIDAKYLSVSDPSATEFTYQREHPARDWAVIDLAVSVVLPDQLQPFVNFTTIQGNENFVSYGGTLGMRVAL